MGTHSEAEVGATEREQANRRNKCAEASQDEAASSEWRPSGSDGAEVASWIGCRRCVLIFARFSERSR